MSLGPDAPEKKGPVFGFQVEEGGEGVSQDKGLGMGGIHTRYERVGCVFENFLAEASAKEVGHAFGFTFFAPWQKWFDEEAQLATKGEEGGGKQGHRGRGSGDELSFADDESLGGLGIGVDSPVDESDFLKLFESVPRPEGESAGAVFDQVAFAFFRTDDPAGRLCRLQHKDAFSQVAEFAGDHETAKTGPDDDCSVHAGKW